MGQSRCTISKPVTVAGIGLHSGAETSVCMRPAPPGQGIVFSRIDLPGRPSIKASVDAVADSDRRTSIGSGETTIGTVEHLLAAVYACGVDDITIEVDGPEPPIGDGSAIEIFEALVRADIKETDCSRKFLRVDTPHRIVDGSAEYSVVPSDGLSVAVTIEWNHPAIGRQSGDYDLSRDTFAESLARARTFGFKAEVTELRARGLAMGASESTVIVLTETGVEGADLRWPDEFVRHKAVDLVGDLALVGARIEAHIVALRPNHRSNITLARFLARTANMDGLL